LSNALEPPYPGLSCTGAALHAALQHLHRWVLSHAEHFDQDVPPSLQSSAKPLRQLTLYYLDQAAFCNMSISHQYSMLSAVRAIRERYDMTRRFELEDAGSASAGVAESAFFDVLLHAVVLLMIANLDSERREAAYYRQVHLILDAIEEAADEEMSMQQRLASEHLRLLRYVFGLD
jgi:hypothetical protein